MPLTEEQFNITNFGYIIGTDSPIQSLRADIPYTMYQVPQELRLEAYGINSGVGLTNMVGFAVGATRYTINDLIDPIKLLTAFERAHKLLFALAIQSMLSQGKSESSTNPAAMRGTKNSVVVVRSLAIEAEAFLGLVIVLTVCLVIFNYRRHSELREDPASVGDLIKIFDTVNFSAIRGQKNARVKLRNGKLEIRPKPGQPCRSKTSLGRKAFVRDDGDASEDMTTLPSNLHNN